VEVLANNLQVLFQGLALGSIYALVALGFVLIIRATNVVNFAQGDFAMLGGYAMVLFLVGMPGNPELHLPGFEMHLPYSQSLKDKRMVLRRVKDRLQKFNVAVAEVDHQDLWQRATLGIVAGLTSLTFGIPGTVLGGYLADRLRRTGRGGRMRLAAIAALFAVPFWIALLFSYSVPLLLVSQAILLSLSLIWIAPSMADVHEMAGPHLRGLGAGVFLCIVMIVAYGIGSPLIGKLNDLFGAATNPGMMRYGFLVSPFSCILAAIFLWRGSKVLEKFRESA